MVQSPDVAGRPALIEGAAHYPEGNGYHFDGTTDQIQAFVDSIPPTDRLIIALGLPFLAEQASSASSGSPPWTSLAIHGETDLATLGDHLPKDVLVVIGIDMGINENRVGLRYDTQFVHWPGGFRVEAQGSRINLIPRRCREQPSSLQKSTLNRLRELGLTPKEPPAY